MRTVRPSPGGTHDAWVTRAPAGPSPSLCRLGRRGRRRPSLFARLTPCARFPPEAPITALGLDPTLPGRKTQGTGAARRRPSQGGKRADTKGGQPLANSLGSHELHHGAQATPRATHSETPCTCLTAAGSQSAWRGRGHAACVHGGDPPALQSAQVRLPTTPSGQVRPPIRHHTPPRHSIIVLPRKEGPSSRLPGRAGPAIQPEAVQRTGR